MQNKMFEKKLRYSKFLSKHSSLAIHFRWGNATMTTFEKQHVGKERNKAKIVKNPMGKFPNGTLNTDTKQK